MNSKLLSFLLIGAIALCASPTLASSNSGATAWVSSNHIQVIDIDSGAVIGRLPLREFIHEMQFSGTGDRLYVGTSQSLRVVDPEQMAFTGVLSARRTKAVAVSRDGEHVFAVHPGDPDLSQQARKAGTPLPLATLSHYSTRSMTETNSWQVPAMSFDVAISPTGDRVFVLDPTAGEVQIYKPNGELLDEVTVAPLDANERPQQAMLGWMAVSPDGNSLVVPVTVAAGPLLARVDLGSTTNTRRVSQDPLKTSGRVQGLAWNAAGDSVLITSVGGLCNYTGVGTAQTWTPQKVNYVDIEPIPATTHSVAVAPVFSERNKSGGISVVSERGEVVRSIELSDMSPFFVAVRP